MTRRGREFSGLCPFHQEKSPSFTISEEKGFYHCFGCNQHGNAVDFIMAIEGLDFGQAIQRLADLTGLPTPMRTSKKSTQAEKTLHQANEAAARWFQNRLSGAGGNDARAYVERRGLDSATVERFGLGYAPAGRRSLRDALIAEGFAEADLVRTGLLIEPEDGGGCYDRFRHRLMFPILDSRGRVVGFGGRALGDARAKYLNTPETELFHKGELLYGLSLARTAARHKGSIVVAEGYMDVIALARAGFEHAVAPLGTAVTEAQLALLWQVADEPIICLDGDEAGLRAGHRLIERALPKLKPGKSLRFAVLPNGSDPDDMLKLGGQDKLAQLLDEAMPLLDFLWQSETRQRALDTPERQAALRARLSDLSRSIDHPEVRQLFREAFRQQWRSRFGGYRGDSRQKTASYIAPETRRGVGEGRLAAGVAKPETVSERQLLGPLIVHPTLLNDVEEELAALVFVDPTLEALRQEIISWYSENEDLDRDRLSNHLCTNGFATVIQQLTETGPSPISTVWYCRPDLQKIDVLDAWRARLEQYRRFRDRRGVGKAAWDALAGKLEDEARVQLLTTDQLLNHPDIRKPRGGR
ncbi:MAG: DNA primase [Alphaproteobacteria bacterium]|nr:DNA primase [Alphaproteobacteria bacterium]